MAWNSETRCTRRVEGKEAVKMGSKIAARYNASIGEALEDAITLPGRGSRAVFWDRDPLFTPSICRSIHHMPGTPSMDHKDAFLPRLPIGNHCRKKKYPRVTVNSDGTRTMNKKKWNGR